MLQRLIVMTVGLIAVLAASLPAGAQHVCPETLPARLAVGALAQVTPGGANNVRDLPTTTGARIGQLLAETVIRVLEGPTCADGFAWWRVATVEDTLTGWTVEAVGEAYALQPYAPAAPMVPDSWLTAGDMGVAIAYSPDLEMNVTFTFIEGVPPAEILPDEGWLADPDTIVVDFDRDETIDNGRNGRIFISPRAAHAQINPTIAENFAVLADVLANRQPPDRELVARLDFMYFAAQIAGTLGGYIETESLAGIRFVANHAQDVSMVYDGQVAYHFYGFTKDGEYFIDAVFFLDSPRLPALSEYPASIIDPASEQPYPEESEPYLIGYLNSLPTEAFIPPLNLIDSAIATLMIEQGLFAAYRAALEAAG